MNNMSMSFKLIISNLIYIVPAVILISTTIKPYNETIDFSEAERNGNYYQAPVMRVFEKIGLHSLVAQRALHHDVEAKLALADLEKNIDQDMEALLVVDERLGVDLKFVDAELKARGRDQFKAATLKSEWEILKKDLPSLTPEKSVERHTQLVTILRGIIAHLGDTSNLILDPDLDSYYLMDITLCAMPQMHDRLVEILTKTESIVRKKAITTDDRIWLIASAAFLKKSDLERVVSDSQTAFNEDKNFYSPNARLQDELPKATKSLEASVGEVIGILEAISRSGQVEVSLAKWLEVSNKAFSESFSYWRNASEILEQLLSKRIETQVGTKNKNVLFGVISLIIAAIVATLAGLSLKKGILTTVSDTTDKLKDVLEQIVDSNGSMSKISSDLASGTTQQASSVQETAAALDEISAMTSKNAQSAESSAQESNEAEKMAAESQNLVKEMIESLNSISNSNENMVSYFKQTNEQINEFVSMVKEIDNKTKVINEIVFQTKLLSFNASVEAARAGEAGKGFAVVAEEVGQLAAMSGNSAKEISELLSQTSQKIKTVVDVASEKLNAVILDNKNQMNHGHEVAKKCEMALDSASEKVRHINGLVGEVATASNEQSHGVQEISKAIQQIDEATRSSSETATQVNSLSEKLNEQSQTLVDIIQELEKRIGARAKKSS